MYIWDSRNESMPREEIELFQLEKLQAMINRLYLNVPYYRKVFSSAGLLPKDITSLDDIKKIPLTDKEALRDNQPYGLFALPLREIVRFHSTSGTTGTSIAVGYSRNDINHWSELIARTLSSAGVTDHDVVQIAFEYGMFTGGLGFHYGAEKIGASIIPVSSVSAEHQIDIMKNYKTSVLISTPTMALSLGEILYKKGINKNELSLKIGFFGAEPWSESVRKIIENSLGLKAYDTYGLSEIMGPGVAFECHCQEGLHLNEDYFYAEIIDPETGNVMKDKTEGELVLTTLNKEAFPLLRYRTRDLTTINKDICKCGRTTLRFSRFERRTDDVLIFNGLKIYPLAIKKIIQEIDGLGGKFEMKVEKAGGSDVLEILAEIKPGLTADMTSDFLKIKESLQAGIKSIYNINPIIRLVEPYSLSHVKKSYKIHDKR